MTHPETDILEDQVKKIAEHLMGYPEMYAIFRDEVLEQVRCFARWGYWPKGTRAAFEERVESWMDSEFGPSGHGAP